MYDIVIGVDPSLANAALCFYKPTAPDYSRTELIKSKPLGKTVAARIRRCESQAQHIVDAVLDAQPAPMFLEGYSLNSPRQGHYLGEFGGELRRQLLVQVDPEIIYEVTPKSLKQFATGIGDANKREIAAAVKSRYGLEFKTNHECDAYVLARLGACVLGLESPADGAQRKAVKTVTDSHGGEE